MAPPPDSASQRSSSFLPNEASLQSARYHNSFLLDPDEALETAREYSAEKGLPPQSVSPEVGKLLHLLVRSVGAKRVLEIGTLGGYSAIWMGRALPEDGEVITCERNEHHAQVARENIAKAGLEKVVTIMLGSALENLAKLQPGDEPFDFVFIDADKENNLNYLLEAKRLARKGAAIVVDNTVQEGRIADLSIANPRYEGVRKLLAHIKDDPELSATTIATVGDRHWDGFTYILKL
ncbi:S-adenosyl-L-methionine-dependent methyltransferase [Daedalea quercina L-15889]|uniref:S-adenosyl-L-methionine-dependent methyltransferase n=1 Tax=Daedalea quercina L-15889 TaxID=1314783 RepID=A0A165MU76_9APHY|nr:S-adenosyl-L-methionine-dependent methyltransferase [Daedalea quercina L-15889]